MGQEKSHVLYAVTFTESDISGVLVFTATDSEDARKFVREFTMFENCTPVPFSDSLEELQNVMLEKVD